MILEYCIENNNIKTIDNIIIVFYTYIIKSVYLF